MYFTRKGDDGSSGLFGSNTRSPKDGPLYEALGTLDELNSLIGVCFAKSKKTKGEISIADELRAIQQDLFIVQAELAGAKKSIVQSRVDAVEALIGKIEEMVGNPHSFVIAGASEYSAMLDLARAVSRRAERRVIAAKEMKEVSAETKKYLNRLSSLLYALARLAAHQSGSQEDKPSY